MTATYWEIGWHIVEFEQGGAESAGYGEELLKRVSADLTAQFGRGFSQRNLEQMRLFYVGWPISQTLSGEATDLTLSESYIRKSSDLAALGQCFPLPWSVYVRLLSIKNPAARRFYETEALRCGWTVRQLDRQINSQFYERIALSKNKMAMLEQAEHVEFGDVLTPEEAIKDPFVLEYYPYHPLPALIRSRKIEPRPSVRDGAEGRVPSPGQGL